MSFDDAPVITAQIVGALIAFAVFPLQYWQGRQISNWRWFGLCVWIVANTLLVSAEATRQVLVYALPTIWLALAVVVFPDYVVEKVAGRHDREDLTDQLEDAEGMLMLIATGTLDNMRRAGRTEQHMRQVLEDMGLKPRSRDALLKYQRMAAFFPNGGAPNDDPAQM